MAKLQNDKAAQREVKKAAARAELINDFLRNVCAAPASRSGEPKIVSVLGAKPKSRVASLICRSLGGKGSE
jgi:hypothetical protein